MKVSVLIAVFILQGLFQSTDSVEVAKTDSSVDRVQDRSIPELVKKEGGFRRPVCSFGRCARRRNTRKKLNDKVSTSLNLSQSTKRSQPCKR